MRLIGVRDYSVFEDGQHIGRIRFASERTPGVWLWHVQVQIPGPPFGSTANLDDAKQSFKAAWLAFKQRHWAGSTRGGLSRGEQAQRTMTVPRGFIEPCQEKDSPNKGEGNENTEYSGGT